MLLCRKCSYKYSIEMTSWRVMWTNVLCKSIKHMHPSLLYSSGFSLLLSCVLIDLMKSSSSVYCGSLSLSLSLLSTHLLNICCRYSNLCLSLTLFMSPCILHQSGQRFLIALSSFSRPVHFSLYLNLLYKVL